MWSALTHCPPPTLVLPQTAVCMCWFFIEQQRSLSYQINIFFKKGLHNAAECDSEETNARLCSASIIHAWFKFHSARTRSPSQLIIDSVTWRLILFIFMLTGWRRPKSIQCSLCLTPCPLCPPNSHVPEADGNRPSAPRGVIPEII